MHAYRQAQVGRQVQNRIHYAHMRATRAHMQLPPSGEDDVMQTLATCLGPAAVAEVSSQHVLRGSLDLSGVCRSECLPVRPSVRLFLPPSLPLPPVPLLRPPSLSRPLSFAAPSCRRNAPFKLVLRLCLHPPRVRCQKHPRRRRSAQQTRSKTQPMPSRTPAKSSSPSYLTMYGLYAL